VNELLLERLEERRIYSLRSAISTVSSAKILDQKPHRNLQ